MTSKGRHRSTQGGARVELFYFRLGERIAQLRLDQGVTQQQLGKSLNPPLTRAGVSNIESGKQRCLALTLTQIAAALRVDVCDLTEGLDEPLPKADLQIVDDRLLELLVAEGFLVSDGNQYLVTPRGVSSGLAPRRGVPLPETRRFPEEPPIKAAQPPSVVKTGRSLRPRASGRRAHETVKVVVKGGSKRRIAAVSRP